MKRIICNYCRTEAPAEGTYGMAPVGWITVTYPGKYDERHADLDFCQASCATAYIEALAVEDTPKVEESISAA